MKVLKFPLTRITVCFVLGLSAAFYFQFKPETLLILGAVLVTILGLFYLLKNRLKSSFLFGSVASLAFFVFGMVSHAIHTEDLYPNHYSHFTKDRTQIFRLQIREHLKNSALNSRFVASVLQVGSIETEGKILLNLSNDSVAKKVRIGEEIFVVAKFSPHRNPGNPNQFDYGKYLDNKSINGQLYCASEDVIATGIIEKDLYYYADAFRSKIINNLKNSGFEKESLAVLSALILGQQQEISKEILQDYQFAGAVHILSVSGLHVGCLMLFIGFLLKPLPNSRYYNWFRLISVIAFLWIFALIAGFSASVVRSVVMFSFVAVGQFANRKTNLIHTLLVSMLLILVFRPSFLVDVGFQLSYSALFFIAWLQPRFSEIWQPENKILSYFFDILTVSFAAQIGTLPLSLYYFHQFPGLFFVTNLVILPFVSIIMGYGLLLMILAYFDVIWKPSLDILETAIIWLNKIIHKIASWDSFLFREIPFNALMMLTCFLMIFALGIWLEKHSYKKMIAGFTCILLFEIACLWTVFQSRSLEETIVFSDRKNLIIAENSHSSLTLFSRDSISKNSLQFAIQPYSIAQLATVDHSEKIKNVLFSAEKRIMVIDSNAVYPENIRPEIIIVSQSPKLNLERLLLQTNPEVVIADASNYKNYVRDLEAVCRNKKIPFHSIYEKGFYRIEK